MGDYTDSQTSKLLWEGGTFGTLGGRGSTPCSMSYPCLHPMHFLPGVKSRASHPCTTIIWVDYSLGISAPESVKWA